MAGTSCKPNIKWPNDIYVNEKKISGVLIENSLRGNDVTTSVIGIGININQETFEDTGYKATSLKNSCKKEFDLNACYNVLCESIEARYLQYLNKNSDSIKADYHKKLFRLNQVCNFDVGGKTRQGKIIGVSREGKLLLALTEGFTVLELGLKEVKFL